MQIEPENQPVLSSKYQPQWGRTTRTIATVFLIVASIYALTLLGPVIQMLTFAFLLAFVMYAPARAMTRRSVLPWAGSVAVLYLLLVLVVLGALLIIIPAFINGADSLLEQGATAYNNLLQNLRDYQPQDGIATILGVQLDFNPILTPIRDFVLGAQPDSENGTINSDILGSINLQEVINGLFNIAGTVTGTVTSAITGVTGFVTTLLLAVFISFLILVDLPHSQRQVANWIPLAYHREAALLIEKLRRVWNGFFRGQVLIGFIIGGLTWIQLMLMGVPGVAVLAIFTGVISLIPTIGGFFALIPLFLVPAFQGSTVFLEMPNLVFALLVIGVNLVISQVIWNVVAPKILGDALDLPLPVIIVGVFIGAAVGGILGAFLVAPIMSTIRVFVWYIISKIAQQDPFPGEVPTSPLNADTPLPAPSMRAVLKMAPPVGDDSASSTSQPTG